MSKDAARLLRDLTATPPQVAVGVVELAEASGGGYLLSGTLQPSGAPFVARMLFGPIGAGIGDLFPVAVGDEVLVLYPDRDPNRAVAIWGGNSSAAALPSSFTNDKPRLVHPDGKTFSTSAGAAVQPVLVEALLPDLQAAMSEILALFGALAAFGITLPSTNLATLISGLPTLYRSQAVFSE